MVAWLNVALQPCAMALADDSAACPYCPAAHSHEQMTDAPLLEHDHAMAITGDEGSPNGADGQEMDSGSATCGGKLIECANLDDVNQADRQQQLAPDTRLARLAPPLAEVGHSDERRLPPSFRPGDAARPTGAFPPLNVLYCVYLD